MAISETTKPPASQRTLSTPQGNQSSILRPLLIRDFGSHKGALAEMPPDTAVEPWRKRDREAEQPQTLPPTWVTLAPWPMGHNQTGQRQTQDGGRAGTDWLWERQRGEVLWEPGCCGVSGVLVPSSAGAWEAGQARGVGDKEEHRVLIRKSPRDDRIQCPGFTCSVSTAGNYFSRLRKNCLSFLTYVCACTRSPSHPDLLVRSRVLRGPGPTSLLQPCGWEAWLRARASE